METKSILDHKNSRLTVDSLDHSNENLKTIFLEKCKKNFDRALAQLEEKKENLFNYYSPKQKSYKPLTVRECERLYLSAKGMTNSSISKKLSITRHTVKSHFDNIFKKLGVSNRTMAVVWAVTRFLS